MILSMGPGQPNYIPDRLIGQPHDFVDVRALAFLQCYARELTQWEIISFFSEYQDAWCSLDMIAGKLEQPAERIADKLVMLSKTRLLEERIIASGPVYRLTAAPQLRRSVVGLGCQWCCAGARTD
jgi:hypothetical protein